MSVIVNSTNILLIRWECRTDRFGRTYYADHNTHTTTWKKPTAESVRNFQRWKQQEASKLKERSQQHQQRFLLEGGDDEDPEDDGLGPLPEGWGECHVMQYSTRARCAHKHYKI